MSECYRVGLTLRRRRVGSGVGGAQGGRRRSQQPADRAGDGALRARGPVLHRHRARACNGPVAPCYHARLRPGDRRRSTCCSATPHPRSSATRSAAPQLEQATLALTQLGARARPAARRSGAGGRRVDQPGVAAQPGADRSAVRRLRRPLLATRSRPRTATCASASSPRFDAYLAQEGESGRPQGLVHGDYRLDNMLFGEAGADRPLTVVDWQTVTWGPAIDRRRVLPRLRTARATGVATTTTSCCAPTTPHSGPTRR